jgi:hypothetical protein
MILSRSWSQVYQKALQEIEIEIGLQMASVARLGALFFAVTLQLATGRS